MESASNGASRTPPPTRCRFTILFVGRDAYIAPRIPDAEPFVPAWADVGIGPYEMVRSIVHKYGCASPAG